MGFSKTHWQQRCWAVRESLSLRNKTLEMNRKDWIWSQRQTWISEKGAAQMLFSTRIAAISPSRSPILPSTLTKCPLGYRDVDSQESMRTTTLNSCRETALLQQLCALEKHNLFPNTTLHLAEKTHSKWYVSAQGSWTVAQIQTLCFVTWQELNTILQGRNGTLTDSVLPRFCQGKHH